jgi:hypothetical protein
VALGISAGPAGAQGSVTLTVDRVDDPVFPIVSPTGADAAAKGCVTGTPDDCSLRGAIEVANGTPDADTIDFGIPGAGTKTITVNSTLALPPVTQPATIDGYTQAGSSRNTNGWFADAFAAGGTGSNAVLTVEINLNDKASAGTPGNPRGGLVLGGNGSSIAGVAIYNAPEPVSGNDLPALTLRGPGNIEVTGCFIGLKGDGTAPPFDDRNAGVGINVESGDGHTIGGLVNSERNVISGANHSNAGGGIRVEGGGGHKIQGNLIGTRPSGLADTVNDPSTDLDFTNSQLGGITVNDFNPANLGDPGGTSPLVTNLEIGGSSPNAGNLISNNGHSSGAVEINGPWTTEEVHILRNRIGTDVTGQAALSNNAVAGISADAPVDIGSPGNGNLISGNGRGVRIRSQDGSTVQSNRIGTDAGGDDPLPNSFTGLLLESDDALIGGSNHASGADERNIISGNGGFGIGTITSSGNISGNDIQGNYIGTTINGSTALPNGAGGISLDGAVQTTIGGAGVGTENIIGANDGPGIRFGLPEGTVNDGNVVIGNKIGVNASNAALGNSGPGVQVHNGLNNVIGRAVPGEGNTIANNGGDGVLISGRDEGTFGNEAFHNDGNSIRGNSIFSNGGLGIDLGEDNGDEADDGDAVTPNDPGDGDSGNNGLQNFPLVNAALPGGSTFVRGFIGSRPQTSYTIDVYRTASCDASGNGEGAKWLGSTTTTTNGSGRALWNTTVTESVPLGEFVTATATDPSGNTSELSACRQSGTQIADQAIEDPVEEQRQEPQQEQQQPAQQQAAPQQQQQQPTQLAPVNPCTDKKPPITKLKKAGVKQTSRGTKLVLNGTSADDPNCPSGLARVDVSLARVKGRTGTNCRFIKKPNRYSLTGPQNCRRPVLFKATGTDKWTYTFPVRLKAGLYRVQARATDKAKNKETPKKARNIVFFEVK